MSCEVCYAADSKYKCVCLVKYCSVQCYKDHKANQECKKPEKIADSCESVPRESDAIAKRRDYPREDIVPPRLLEYLKTSRSLREALSNPYLRELLKSLAAEKEPSRMLDHLMKEPLFTEFVDACLEVIQPPED